MVDKVIISKLHDEYLRTASSAKLFSDELTHQIQSLLSQTTLRLGFPIQTRVKTWNSIKNKVCRPEFRKVSTLGEITDLIGIRLAFVFLQDAKDAIHLLSNKLNVVNAYDKNSQLNVDQFGYSSYHMLVRLPIEWKCLPSIEKISDYYAEIQIRSLSQHIWAEVSHILQYKNENNVPDTLRRKIHKASALLETVDDEFSRILEDRKSYRNQIDPNNIDSNLILNSDILELFLDTNLPKENKKPFWEAYALLVNELEQVGILNVNHLIELISTTLPLALDKDNKVAAQFKKSTYLSHTGLIRSCLEIKFGENKLREIMINSGKQSGADPLLL